MLSFTVRDSWNIYKRIECGSGFQKWPHKPHMCWCVCDCPSADLHVLLHQERWPERLLAVSRWSAHLLQVCQQDYLCSWWSSWRLAHHTAVGLFVCVAVTRWLTDLCAARILCRWERPTSQCYPALCPSRNKSCSTAPGSVWWAQTRTNHVTHNFIFELFIFIHRLQKYLGQNVRFMYLNCM